MTDEDLCADVLCREIDLFGIAARRSTYTLAATSVLLDEMSDDELPSSESEGESSSESLGFPSSSPVGMVISGEGSPSVIVGPAMSVVEAFVSTGSDDDSEVSGIPSPEGLSVGSGFVPSTVLSVGSAPSSSIVLSVGFGSAPSEVSVGSGSVSSVDV